MYLQEAVLYIARTKIVDCFFFLLVLKDFMGGVIYCSDLVRTKNECLVLIVPCTASSAAGQIRPGCLL